MRISPGQPDRGRCSSARPARCRAARRGPPSTARPTRRTWPRPRACEIARRRRQRLPRLPRQLHLADPRPRPSGGRRGGRGAGPARLGVRRADRDRRSSWPRRSAAGVPSIERLRFTNSRAPRRRCSRCARRGRSPGRPLIARFDHAVSRHPRHGHGRDARRPGRRLGDLVVELPWDDSEGVEAGLRRPRGRPRRDHHRAGPGRRRRPRRGARLPALPPATTRIATARC